jgi:hypothetical protein
MGDYKEKKFASHSSSSWEVQDQDTSRLGTWQRLALYFQDKASGCILTWQQA